MRLGQPAKASSRVVIPCTIIAETIDRNIPWAYFDGSAQQNGSGGGCSFISLPIIFSEFRWV